MVDCDQDHLKRNESESLAKKVISDHMRFVCANRALELWNKRYLIHNNPHEDRNIKIHPSVDTRKRVLLLIEEGYTFEAFSMCEDLRLFNMEIDHEEKTKEILSKLVFVDLLRTGKHMNAVGFAKSFMNNENERDKLFTLIGYKDVNDPRFIEISRSIQRDEVIEVLNRHLFKKEVGRESSLLSLALNHYNSIMKCQKK